MKRITLLILLIISSDITSQTLVSYWPFTGNANDSTASGNNGTVIGATLSNDRYGVANRCYLFNGTNNYISGSNPGVNLPTGSTARTITAWIKSNYAYDPNYDRVVFHFGTAESAPTNFHLGVYRTGHVFIGNGYGYGGIKGRKRVDDTTWHFIVGLYEGPGTNLQRIYIDGVLDTLATSSTVPNTILNTNWKIGDAMASQPVQFTGKMDEIRVYSGALTAAQILALYNQGTTAPNLISPPNNSTGISNTPLLDWDSLFAANSYRVQISADPLFNSITWDTSGVTRSQLTVPVGRLVSNMQYYWRVNMIYSGERSPGSMVFAFATSTVTADTCFASVLSCGSGSNFTLMESKCDANGNIYAAGNCSVSGNVNMITVKYNSSGILQWAQVFDTSLFDTGGSIDIDASGNVYVSGTMYPGAVSSLVTIKYNSSGVRQWLRSQNSPFGSANGYSRVRVDASGNVYTAGSLNLPWDLHMFKYNSSGILQWSQIWNGPGNYDDILRDMTIDQSGNVIMLADTRDPGPLNINNYATVKYNSSGVFQWAQIYNRYSEAATSITTDKFDNVIVTGNSSPGSGGLDDIATVKYNSAGAQQWVQIYSRPQNDFDYAFGIAADTLGNVYVAGGSQNLPLSTDAVTIKYSSGGAQQWVQSYKYNDSSTINTSISLDRFGNIYSIGQARYNNIYQLIASKYNSNGVMQWQKITSGGSSMNTYYYVRRLSADNTGNLYSVTAKTSGGVENLQVIKYCQTNLVGTGSNLSNEIPQNYILYQNYPNPFNPVTKIKFDLPTQSHVILKIFNITGQEVSSPVSGELKAGTHEVSWNASSFPSGVYFYVITTENFTEAKKMVLIK